MNDRIKIYSDKLAKDFEKKIANFDIKALDESNGTFKVIASDETKDRHGEIIKVSGWKLDNYMKNPIMLFGHDYRSIENVVGKATRVYVENNQLIIEGVFASQEANPKAQMVRNMYEEGIINTVSVGLKVLRRNSEDSDIIEEAELLECSFVPVPANPSALSIRGYKFDDLVKAGIFKSEEQEENKSEGEEDQEEETENKELSTKDMFSQILKSFDEVKEILKSLADGNANKLTDKEIQAKEALQEANKTISELLRGYKYKRS